MRNPVSNNNGMIPEDVFYIHIYPDKVYTERGRQRERNRGRDRGGREREMKGEGDREGGGGRGKEKEREREMERERGEGEGDGGGRETEREGGGRGREIIFHLLGSVSLRPGHQIYGFPPGQFHLPHSVSEACSPREQH